MKFTSAATSLFLAATVLLVTSPSPNALVIAQRHNGNTRHPVRRPPPPEEEEEEEEEDDQPVVDPEVDDDPTTTTPKPTTQPPANGGETPTQGNCRRIVRSEIRDMSTDARNRYWRAIHAIQRRPSAKQPSEYDKLVYEHQYYSKPNHGAAAFLPWHRIFMRRFEIALQRVDPTIAVPYWEWAADAQAPELSPIFSPQWYGTNGNPRRGGCIQDGQFKDFQPFYKPAGPNCLVRKWSGGNRIGAFASPETIATMITENRDYHSFRVDIEGLAHGGVHNGIGGIMQTMYSPADPVFWLHHGTIDKLFMDWQLLSPSTRFNQFNDRTIRSVTPNSLLVPYNVPARVGLQINVLGACVSYASAVNAYRGRRPPTVPRTGGNGGRPVTRPPPTTRPSTGRPTNGGRRVVVTRPGRRVVRRPSQPSTRRVVRRIRPRSLDATEDNAFPVNPATQTTTAEALVAPAQAESTKQDTTPVEAKVAPQEEVSKVEPLAEVKPASTEAKPEVTPVKTEAKEETKPETTEAKPTVAEAKPEVKEETKPVVTEAKPEIKPLTNSTTLNSTAATNTTSNSTDLSGTKVVIVDAPKPQDLPKTCKDANGIATPCPDDRENILDLRAPAPLPEHWILSNGLDVETIRKQEEKARKLVSKLNDLDGYVSPAALYNRDDFMAELAKQGTDFKCVYKGKLIVVEYDKDSVTTGYRTAEKVKKQVEQVVPTYKPIYVLEPKLNKILGDHAVKRLKHKYSKIPIKSVYGGHDDNDDEVCEADDY